jgi:hypothetical protein
MAPKNQQKKGGGEQAPLVPKLGDGTHLHPQATQKKEKKSSLGC